MGNLSSAEFIAGVLRPRSPVSLASVKGVGVCAVYQDQNELDSNLIVDVMAVPIEDVSSATKLPRKLNWQPVDQSTVESVTDKPSPEEVFVAQLSASSRIQKQKSLLHREGALGDAVSSVLKMFGTDGLQSLHKFTDLIPPLARLLSVSTSINKGWNTNNAIPDLFVIRDGNVTKRVIPAPSYNNKPAPPHQMKCISLHQIGSQSYFNTSMLDGYGSVFSTSAADQRGHWLPITKDANVLCSPVAAAEEDGQIMLGWVTTVIEGKNGSQPGAAHMVFIDDQLVIPIDNIRSIGPRQLEGPEDQMPLQGEVLKMHSNISVMVHMIDLSDGGCNRIIKARVEKAEPSPDMALSSLSI
jgi:hypothetical protein